ncbi:MAG: DUF4255 domain-containing protein [Saprospiraceae bacterium]|nr:DUF4255 domain-containing protein [Saprospiraceae bacterium]
MIEQTLQFIRTQLSEDPTIDLDADEIVADNLHVLQSQTNQDGLFYSLINIEEEPSLRNQPNYDKINGQLRRIEPPIILNLYILFAFKMTTYNASISKLSKLIGFFQTNKWFNINELSDTQSFSPPLDKIVFELYNMNFEQMNHIWSVLGGNHYPSVVYKVRVVKVQRDVQHDASEVTSIELKSGVSN